MRLFMNEIYQNGVGKQVQGIHNDEPFIGKIVSVRAKYGSDLSLTIEQENGKTFLLNATALYNGGDTVNKHLCVYL